MESVTLLYRILGGIQQEFGEYLFTTDDIKIRQDPMSIKDIILHKWYINYMDMVPRHSRPSLSSLSVIFVGEIIKGPSI